jgi:phosphomannomutase
VSTDGDSDRPLVADEQGEILRGDIAALLCAKYVGAKVVVTPVSSNTAVEKCGLFREVVRTRIGSPYVIEAMMAAATPEADPVVGYEANGGFLSASTIALHQGSLSPLATRDAMIVILAVLGLAAESGQSISTLVKSLPPRHTSSDRLKDFPTARAAAIVADLAGRDPVDLAAAFAGGLGQVASTDTTDGLRITFTSGEIAHLRPSGNAPELRCYAEAETFDRARAITSLVLGRVAAWP